MSHFTVSVCLPGKVVDEVGGERALADALAPFDENMSVEPYRSYEEGAPADYWWVGAVRRGAEHHREGTGLREHDPNALGYSSHGPVKETPEQQRAAFAEDAMWAERLGDNPSWADVVAAYNEKYHPHTALAVPGEVDSSEIDTERLHVDEESGRAYTWSTYNPESKWDWYSIGGRWQRHFISIPGADRDLLVFGQPGVFGDNGRPKLSDAGAMYCDGGLIELLDFAAMRDAAALEANRDYDKWLSLVDKFGHPEPWDRLCSLAELKEISWDEARSRYNGQALVKAARDMELVGFFGPSVEAEFGTTREEYEAIKRAAAVPGYALITTSGEWVAPGRMGWFGMSSDGPGEADAFKVQASKYLDELPHGTWVIHVDCHI